MNKLSTEVRENIIESMEENKKHFESEESAEYEYNLDFSSLDDEDLIYYRDEWIVELDEVVSDEQYAEDVQDLFYEKGTDIYKYFGVEKLDQ